jgi:hypothetical protein
VPLKEFHAGAGAPRADVYLALEELSDEEWQRIVQVVHYFTANILSVGAADSPELARLVDASRTECQRLQYRAQREESRRV